MVYHCLRCYKPILSFHSKVYKMDEGLIASNDTQAIEEYVLDLLHEEGIETGHESMEAISPYDIVKMRRFLDNLRIPVDGDFMDGDF